jgi:endonuclease/exonuclease/phosphatase family metal-dependent hydrolase
MTQNQYLGADLSPLFVAATATPFDPLKFNDAVVSVLEQITATKTTERINALAALIAKRQPHLIGLQEVYAFGCIDNPESAIDACNDPSISGAFVDHLSETLTALNGKYAKAAGVTNLNLPPAQSLIPGIPFDISEDGIPDAFLTVVDRDVILNRTDVSASPVFFSKLCTTPSADGCNYSNALEVSTPLGDFSFKRGYIIVDATVNGKNYRFVNTHLEIKDPPIPPELQTSQAAELIDTLSSTSSTLMDKSLIVVGDINSSPKDQSGISPYEKFLENGYNDAWTFRPRKAKGFTCCQLPDLSNRESVLNQRIDMIFSIEAPAEVNRARVLGNKVSSKTHPVDRGLWPSDHGSVAIGLQFH